MMHSIRFLQCSLIVHKTIGKTYNPSLSSVPCLLWDSAPFSSPSCPQIILPCLFPQLGRQETNGFLGRLQHVWENHLFTTLSLYLWRNFRLEISVLTSAALRKRWCKQSKTLLFSFFNWFSDFVFFKLFTTKGYLNLPHRSLWKLVFLWGIERKILIAPFCCMPSSLQEIFWKSNEQEDM
jgi:hypothetical protein